MTAAVSLGSVLAAVYVASLGLLAYEYASAPIMPEDD